MLIVGFWTSPNAICIACGHVTPASSSRATSDGASTSSQIVPYLLFAAAVTNWSTFALT